MKRWQANLIMGLIALIWGSTFVMVQDALDDVAPMTFVAYRFVAATLVLAALFPRRTRTLSPAVLRSGAIIGVWLAGGYIFQTIGLQTTTVPKSGFITGMNVVFVPVLATVLLRRLPASSSLAGIAFATVGMALLMLNGDLHLASGDLWTLGCALMYALHILTISHVANHHDTIQLTIAQLATVSVLAGGSAAIFEAPSLTLPLATWGAILFTGVVATALVFSMQVHVQRYTTATQTALIFSLEPVFAALFGWLLINEVLGPRELIGAGLILLGTIVAELGSSSDDVPGEIGKSDVSEHLAVAEA